MRRVWVGLDDVMMSYCFGADIRSAMINSTKSPPEGRAVFADTCGGVRAR